MKKEPIEQFHFDVERINPLFREHIRKTAIKWGFDKQTLVIKGKKSDEEYLEILTALRALQPDCYLELRLLPEYDFKKGPDEQDWQVWPVFPEPCLEALGEILSMFREIGIKPYSKKKIRIVSG